MTIKTISAGGIKPGDIINEDSGYGTCTVTKVIPAVTPIFKDTVVNVIAVTKNGQKISTVYNIGDKINVTVS